MIAAERLRRQYRAGFASSWTEVSLLVVEVRVENESIRELIHVVFEGRCSLRVNWAAQESHSEMTVDEDDAEDRRQCSCDPGVSFPVLFELQDALAVLIVGVHRVKGLEEHFYHTGPRYSDFEANCCAIFV